jgi:hypothetical protein
MFIRSSMASSARSILPERVSAVLAIRSTNPACPEDVERAILSHSFFKRVVAVSPAPRFGRLPPGGDSGRFGSFRGPSSRNVTDDGFETVINRRRTGGNTTYPNRRQTAIVPSVISASESIKITDEPSVTKFSSAALRASVDVEDRMLARVKGKINRIGHSTYEQTKVFMQQILTGDDTDFLDELMKYIFIKASNESAYCPLYAKLLHELGDEFPHFRVVIYTIFNDYINVFKNVDAGTEPDPSSADYKAFVEAQERKRARRGYSQFVAELVKLGEADKATFATLLQTITSVIESNYTSSDKVLMCEEYIDCLSTMCGTASEILRKADWSSDIVHRLNVIAAKPKTESSGLSNKARFAIMDLADTAKAGWKSRS